MIRQVGVTDDVEIAQTHSQRRAVRLPLRAHEIVIARRIT